MTAGHPTGLVVVLPTGYRRSRSIRSGVDAVVRDPEKASSLSRRSPTLMFLAVVLAALIMLAKASCWAFTMVSANSDQDLKTCFQASSTGAKASTPAESGRLLAPRTLLGVPVVLLALVTALAELAVAAALAAVLAGVVAVLAGVVAIVVRLVPHGGQVLAAFGVVADLVVLALTVLARWSCASNEPVPLVSSGVVAVVALSCRGRLV